MIFSNSHEINASAIESGYTIRPHYRVSPNEDDFMKVTIYFILH